MKITTFAIALGFAACSTAPAPTTSNADTVPKASLLSPNITMADLPIYLDYSKVVAGTFTQEIDHPTDGSPSIGTFQQRYWYSTEFASGPNAPVILQFCQEAECDSWNLQFHADVAKTLGAAVVSLENRYYGASQPMPDETLPSMKYLTIHNVLEDNAAFERWAQVNLPLSGKWIASGGSYSGMLSAYFRLMHPELVVGAWASSAPVNVVLTFTGYDENVANTLGSTCTTLFNQALAAAQAAYEADTPLCSQIATVALGDPTACSTWDETDFLDDISGVADDAGQYGGQDLLCSALEQEQLNPMQGILDYLNPPLVGDATPAAATAKSEPLAPPLPNFPHLQRPDSMTSFAGQEWWYQVCTEVGFFQIANPDRNLSVTPDTVNEAYFADYCQQITGGQPDIAGINATYYAPLAAGAASNILWITGSDDPWSNLSFMDPNAPPPGDVAFNVQGGSHCEDEESLQPDSKLGVFQVHKLYNDLAQTWLDEAQ